jgi:hypothetical protein
VVVTLELAGHDRLFDQSIGGRNVFIHDTPGRPGRVATRDGGGFGFRIDATGEHLLELPIDPRAAEAFLDELESNQGVMAAPDLFTRVSKRVASAAARNKFVQKPEFKSIKGAGHEVGDFFFVPKS